MTKDEALMKSVEEIISGLRVAMTDARQNESHFESWMILNEAICDAIDALAEQPAQCTNSDTWNCKYCHKNKSCDALKDPRNFVGEPAQPAQQQEPVAYGMWDTMLGKDHRMMMVRLGKGQDGCTISLYTSPLQRKPLTDREVELLDGMIEVQLDHARRCDSIGNRPMADKQKAWDMERVELLRKLKAAFGITGETK